MTIITRHNLVVGRIEHHIAVHLEQVHTETVVVVAHTHQTEQRRHDVNLHAKAVVFHWFDTWTKHDERDMVVALGQLNITLAYQLSMVSLYHEDGVLIPRLLPGFSEEVADCPVGILHYLRLRIFGARLKPFGHHIRRMVADGKDGSHEGLLSLCLIVELSQGKVKLEMVAHAKAVDHTVLRVTLL